MRVLVFNPFNDRSEVSMYLGLLKSGINLEVICDPSAAERQILKDGGITVTEMSIRNRLDINAIRNLRRKLKQTKYDVIYTTLNSCLSVSLIASIGIEVKHVSYRGTMGHLSRWDPASWLTYLNPRINRIVCVSEAVRKYLLSLNIPSSRLITIYKGHDPAWYSVMKPPALSNFGIPQNAFTICFTGSMRPVKGVDVLLKSVQHLPANRDFHFLLVGEVKDPRITQLASSPAISKRIHFTGIRNDAAAIAGTCNVFIMPSVAREGLPRSVIEAMAQGVPAIVTDVGGMPELVINNESGLVIPPGDPQALAKAISYLADHPDKLHDMGENARNRITTVFNIRTTVDKTLKLFQEVANHGNQR
ncbi:MAG: glycosyltransferase family 4 protein [Kiritimatiellae bacterium]|nr:glycosyltransferase family 4 protein [Kiritimatiellia bacterium]MDD5522333.1 glycosyltransferase family 4 protein [Kiritimatiellia bacterium]